MENATKALIMAAEVLVGVILISIGIVLFRSFSDYGDFVNQRIQRDKQQEWNNQYLKYTGILRRANDTDGTDAMAPVPVTAHEIVTLANLAEQNNEEYLLETETGDDENLYFVRIDVEYKENGTLKKINNFQYQKPSTLSNTFASEVDRIRYQNRVRQEIMNNFITNNSLVNKKDVLETMAITDTEQTIKYFKCVNDAENSANGFYKVSDTTQRVYYIKFVQFEKKDYENLAMIQKIL